MRRIHTRTRGSVYRSPNLLRYSEQFDNGVWSPGTGGSVAANSVVAPDGNSTADAYTYATSTGGYAYLNQSISGDASQALTYSVWIKVPSGTAPITLAISNASVATKSSSTQTVTTSWQRFAFTLSPGQLANTGQAGVGFLGGNAGQVYHVWGAQLNAGPIAPYQPTA